MQKTWIAAGIAALVLVGGGFALAQSQPGMMGHGQGAGMMGAGGMMGGMGQGGTMTGGMMGQLTPEQLEQFAKAHGITAEQATQMIDACNQFSQGGQPQTGNQQ
jgi:hypothetical protein